MADAMQEGKEAAKPAMNELLKAAKRSGEPALFWAGAISLFCGAMAAQVGAPVTVDALQYLADNITSALDCAERPNAQAQPTKTRQTGACNE